MEFFDTHMHLDDSKFDDDRENIANKIFNSGVTRCVNMGCDIESSKKAIEISNNYDFIYCRSWNSP